MAGTFAIGIQDFMEQNQPFRILWQENSDGSARLLRMYGKFPQVIVPRQIAGCQVTEIAPYCFAKDAHLPKEQIFEEIVAEEGRSVNGLQELSGNAIEEVCLPDSVHSIGNCAFYNCKNLKTLSIGASVESIGSDAFMNTISFHQMILRYPADEKSGLKKILSQISSDMEVKFQTSRGIEAVLLYPEYYESYDEIAPAHLFGRSITGEGFRARQCIKDGRIDFAGYDAVFLQACVEESEKTLAKMALNRLLYPYALQENSKEAYMQYITEHIRTVASCLTEKRELEILQFLCREGLLCGTNLAECIRRAAAMDWAEGAAALLQQQAVMQQEQKKKRYDFDAFGL